MVGFTTPELLSHVAGKDSYLGTRADRNLRVPVGPRWGRPPTTSKVASARGERPTPASVCTDLCCFRIAEAASLCRSWTGVSGLEI